MRFLVTRPDEDGATLAAILTAMGHEAVSAPLLTIRYEGEVEFPDQPWQAVIFTSANGVRALASRPQIARFRPLPVLAVGEASAEAARAAGFDRVEAAGGDVVTLVALALRRLTPQGGPLLHVAGRIVAGDLKGDLERRGFSVFRAPLYDAVVEDSLPQAAAAALAGGRLDGALFYSPRTARTFATLVRGEGLEGALSAVTAYCLSRAVAEALAGLGFAEIRIAETPSQPALLRLLGG
jgi:uroporphyrinogen-III synthase